ncbi:MAG TPA: YceI family protein [Candidatus Sulfotelmatobacter sp.]|nr:YceI family protein [Candidatus Sulfotelmatobacter sp.]
MSAGRRFALAMLMMAALLAAATVIRSLAADTATPVPITMGAGSSLWLEGKSTLHDFESRTSSSTLSLTRDPASTSPADVAGLESLIRGGSIRSVDLDVPVTSLKSEKSGLDKNLWKDLKAEQYPSVKFHLTHYVVSPAGVPGDTMQIRAEGTLEVAGVQRPDTLEARAFRASEGVWLEGSEPLLMSEFGIHPPAMMLGALKVADRIVVRYKLLLVPKGDGSASLPTRVN